MFSQRSKTFVESSVGRIADHNNEHKTDLNWLKANIEQIEANAPQSNHQILVITHHAPVRKGSSKPEHERNPWTDAFATELLDESENHEANALQAVSYWIFGHTHFSTEFRRGRVQIISNQRGFAIARNRYEREPETLNNGSRSKLPLLKRLLDFMLARQRSNIRQQRALSNQTALRPFPGPKMFDVRKCIKN